MSAGFHNVRKDLSMVPDTCKNLGPLLINYCAFPFPEIDLIHDVCTIFLCVFLDISSLESKH